MSAIAKLEYRVKQAPRYYVTRFHELEDGSAGVETKGVYDNPETADEVAYALCKAEHERLGFAPGDTRVRYPDMSPATPGESLRDHLQTAAKSLAERPKELRGPFAVRES